MFMRKKNSRENRDKVEIYLAFGATRVEACRPIAIQALKLTLMPLISFMRYVFVGASLFLAKTSDGHSTYYIIVSSELLLSQER